MYALHSVIWCNTQGCKCLLSIGGDNLQFYPNFALFSTLGWMNLNHDFFQVSKLSEDQKKRSSPKPERFIKNRTIFIPRIHVETCAQTHTSVKFLEGIEKKAILKLLGGIKSNYWGWYIPHPPRVSAPLAALKVSFRLQFLLLRSLWQCCSFNWRPSKSLPVLRRERIDNKDEWQQLSFSRTQLTLLFCLL